MDLPVGTFLARVHSSAFGGAEFNPIPSSVLWEGGRFDATSEDPYGFLYAGESDSIAVAEAILRDVPLHDRGARIIPRAAVKRRLLSRIRTTDGLRLVKLHGPGLSAVGHAHLTSAESRDYPFTRAWGSAIRQWVPDAQGFQWRSRRNDDGFSYVFFGDRCRGDAFEVVPHPLLAIDARLDQEPGLTHLRTLLNDYGCTID